MKIPETMQINGREYLTQAAYLKKYGYRDNEGTALAADGIPHERVRIGNRVFRYFNVADCEKWHRGEA